MDNKPSKLAIFVLLVIAFIIVFQCCNQRPTIHKVIYKKWANELFDDIKREKLQVIEIRNLDKNPEGQLLVIYH